jgi:hypothetical protein
MKIRQGMAMLFTQLVRIGTLAVAVEPPLTPNRSGSVDPTLMCHLGAFVRVYRLREPYQSLSSWRNKLTLANWQGFTTVKNLQFRTS